MQRNNEKCYGTSEEGEGTMRRTKRREKVCL